MSNDKVPATFHPDEEKARIAEARGKRQDITGLKPGVTHHVNVNGGPTQHFDPSDAPIPHAHMDEH